MKWASVEIQNKRFRTRWIGLDAKEVQLFCEQLTAENHRLKAENIGLRKDLQEQAKELHEHREREGTIRAVLLNVQKTAEQMKANAEKEAKFIVTEAELKAEKILQSAHQRLARLDGDIAELKRQRIQLETKLRFTIQTYQQLLDMDQEEDKQDEPVSKVKLLNR